MEELLQVSSLSAGYRDLQVTRDVDLAVRPGEITVLLGRNGAGKSTTLSAIAGLVKRFDGQVRLRGVDISSRPPHARASMGLALVQENKRIFRSRTVEENLLIGGFTIDRRARRKAVEQAYEQFPMLFEKRRDLAGGLSGGQQQMLAIAQALVPGPSVVLLDEPSAGLAPVIVKEVFRIVDRLKQTGLGILLVEQLVDDALSVADGVVLLDRGKVVTHGAEAGMPDFDAVRAMYLGRRDSVQGDA